MYVKKLKGNDVHNQQMGDLGGEMGTTKRNQREILKPSYDIASGKFTG